jgi:ribosomal RNA-processing protein 7
MAPIQKHPIATTVNDFVVLPLRYPAVPSFPKETTHHLYIRANAPKVPTVDTPRELFLVNVPIDATEVHIRSLFADQLGGARIENVAFESARVGKGITAPVAPARRKRKRDQNGEDGEEGEDTAAQVGQLPATYNRAVHRSGSTAVATFVDKASAELALKEAKKAIKSNKHITWAAGVESKVSPLGSARYLSHHKLRYPSRHDLQASIDAFMGALSAQEVARARAHSRQLSVPDADGFITVGRGGKGDAAREEAARLKGEELAKRQKKMIGEDFYRFQVREKKKDEAKDLVRGFEEDRRKVEELRKRRGKARPE